MTILMFSANIAWVSYNSILLLPLVQKVVPADRSQPIRSLLYVRECYLQSARF